MKFREDKISKEYKTVHWLLIGAVFGILSYVVNKFVIDPICGAEITLKSLLIGIPIWLLAGLLFGLSVKYIRKNTIKISEK